MDIKFNIKKLEKKLNVKIKQNTLSLGFDGALLKSGICLLLTNKKEISIVETKVIIHPKLKVITERINATIEDFNKIQLPDSENRVAVIEYPFIGSNRQTGLILALTDGAIYEAVSRKFPYTFFLSAVSARARIGYRSIRRTPEQIKNGVKKVNTKKAVGKYVKETIGFISKSDDIEDAFVLALAGLIEYKRRRL